MIEVERASTLKKAKNNIGSHLAFVLLPALLISAKQIDIVSYCATASIRLMCSLYLFFTVLLVSYCKVMSNLTRLPTL